MSQDYVNKLIQQYQQSLQNLSPPSPQQPSNPVLNFNFQQQQQNSEMLELQEFLKTPEGAKLEEEGRELAQRQRDGFNKFRALKQNPMSVEQNARIEELTLKLAEMEKRDSENAKRNDEMYRMMSYLTQSLTGGDKKVD